MYGGGARCDEFLSDLLENNPKYTSFGVADVKGNILCAAPLSTSLLNVSERLYFQKLIKTKIFSIGEYMIGQTTEKLSLGLGYPVFGTDNEVKAVVIAGLSTAWFDELTNEAKTLPEGVMLGIIDQNGTVLAHYPRIENMVGKALFYDPVLQEILTQREGTAEAVGLDDVARLYVFTPLSTDTKNPGTILFIKGIPIKILLDQVRRDTINHISVLSLSVLIMFLIMLFAGRIIFRKLGQID